MRQDVSFFDQNHTGELLNRLSSDTQVSEKSSAVAAGKLFCSKATQRLDFNNFHWSGTAQANGNGGHSIMSWLVISNPDDSFWRYYQARNTALQMTQQL
jgi:hypothetical protein